MHKKFLIDTNVAIYLYNLNPKYIKFFKDNKGEYFLSTISYVEILLGEMGSEVIEWLSDFRLLAFDKKSSHKALAQMYKNNKKGFRKNKLADLFIASTAISNKLPLVTNNPKDFKMFDELDLIVP